MPIQASDREYASWLSGSAGAAAASCRKMRLDASNAVNAFAGWPCSLRTMPIFCHRYDLKNVVDLARYLLPTPPVPVGWRRRLLALGSGEPTQAICSTMIAQAFQSVSYPILPTHM